MATTIRENTTAKSWRSITSDCGRTFYQWFIWIGGAGATIGLAILLAFRAKSEYGSKLGKAILAPSILILMSQLFSVYRLS